MWKNLIENETTKEISRLASILWHRFSDILYVMEHYVKKIGDTLKQINKPML